MALADEKYVALTTYRRNGESSSTPVWIADLGDGTLGFTTSSSSLKVRRLDNDERVLVQPSDSRGRPVDGSSAVPATARVSATDFERVRARIKAKYGWQVPLIQVIGRIAALFGKRQVSDTAVIIRLDE